MGNRFNIREKKNVLLTRQIFVLCNNIENSIFNNVKDVIETCKNQQSQSCYLYTLYDIKTDSPISKLEHTKKYVEKNFIEFDCKIDSIILLSEKNIGNGKSLKGLYSITNEEELKEILNKITT